MTRQEPANLYDVTVTADWMDYNGHMNVASYVLCFDRTMDIFLDQSGLGKDYAQQKHGSVFALQNHIHYLGEVKENDRIGITLQMLDLDEKRLHMFFRMFNRSRDCLAATSELLAIHVDMTTRKSSPFPEAAFMALSGILAEHKTIRRPALAGRGIGTRVKI